MNKFEKNYLDNGIETPPDDEIIDEGVEKEKEPKKLYYFTIDPELIMENGFRGSENIDKGIGGNGQSLHGTHFFNDLEEAEDYKPLFDAQEKKLIRKA